MEKGAVINGIQTYKFYVDDIDPDKGEFHQFVHEWDYKNILDENQKLKAQLEKAEAVISFYGDENSWYLHKDPETGAEVRRSIEFFDTETFGFQDTPESRNILKVFGGKRAREYFKEKGEL